MLKLVIAFASTIMFVIGAFCFSEPPATKFVSFAILFFMLGLILGKVCKTAE
jgi:hypothetical protein